MNAFDLKVEYRKNPPSAYKYVQALAQDKADSMSAQLFLQVLLTYKHKEWEYEKEVRIIREKVGDIANQSFRGRAIFSGRCA